MARNYCVYIYIYTIIYSRLRVPTLDGASTLLLLRSVAPLLEPQSDHICPHIECTLNGSTLSIVALSLSLSRYVGASASNTQSLSVCLSLSLHTYVVISNMLNMVKGDRGPNRENQQGNDFLGG